MSKYTGTKIARSFDMGTPYEDKGGIMHYPKQMRKAERTPAALFSTPCLACGNPMTVGYGQVAKYHKECRAGRRRQRNQGK